jgi:hypothetical protein
MATGKEIRESKEWQSGSLEDRQKIFAEKVAKDPDFRASSGQTQKEIYEAFFPPAAPEASAEAPAAPTAESPVEQEASPYPEIQAPTEQDRAITSQAGGTEAKDTGRNLLAGVAFGGIKGLLEKYLLSQDKLQREVYGRALKNTLLEAGIDVTRIKDEASLIQAARNMTGQQMAGKEAQLAALEQQAAQFRSMIPPEPPVSTGFPSPLEDALQAGRASGPKVEGASGASNWMRAMAGEGHQLPNVALDAAQDMTKANPKGGQALINQDLANLQKIKQLGAGDFQLAGQGRGQLMLPPEAAAGVTAQESARAAEAAAQEAARAAQQADIARDALKIIQPQIATVQAEIDRLGAMGRDVSVYTRRLEELRRMEGLAQRSLKKNGIVYPQQAKVGFLPQFGAAMGGKGFLPIAGNVFSGAGAFYDIGEAFDRASNKDPLGAAVHVVSSALNMMAMVPPTNVPLATTKAIGTLGSIPMLGAKALVSPPPKTDVRQITQPGGLMQVPQQMIMDYLREKFPSMR